jgi:vitamin K-dependent gamma-carboxylase-like protein
VPAAFGALWAVALLYHQVAYRAVLASAVDAGLVLAALAVLLRPWSAGRLALLAALHVAAVARDLPSALNHWYFGGLVSLGLLLAIAAAWRARRGDAAAPAEPYLAFAPAGRACLLLVYLLSGFHKLNADFLDPAVSCGATLYATLARRLWLPDGGALAEGAAIGGTLLLELGLPMLLLFPRTRLAGVLLAVPFHVALGLAGYPRFSALCLALLLLFLPPPAPASTSRRPLALHGRDRGTASTPGWLARVWSRLAAGPPLGRPLFAPRAGVAMLAPALILASGLAPYAGLGTERAFSMYSNLRTEGGRSNHFLVPASAQLFPYQRDLVEVRSSSVPRLRTLAARGLAVPAAELRAMLSEEMRRGRRELAVGIVRGGAARDIAAAEHDPELALPVSAVALNLLRFRAIEIAGPRHCGT